MIRIDEIYHNTFWAWLKENRPGVRMLMCAPFGASDPGSLINYGRSDILENNYTLFFDVQPIDLAIHAGTFDMAKHYILDISLRDPAVGGSIVTSEKDSDSVDEVCRRWGWKSYYYFFWGWAALDWYRGYDKTFLMKPPEERTITKTFIMPNRILGGTRRHRLLMLYHIFKNNMTDNWISCPDVCPGENHNVHDIVKQFNNVYPDIEQVFAQQQFPINFPGESDAPMHSCWLSLFNESADSLLYLVAETVAHGRKLHLTEKSFKPICLRMPFIIIGTAGSLRHLRSYGFKTFSDLWDESYDDETDDVLRVERIASLLRSLDELPTAGKQELFDAARDIVEHNYNHFYGGGFEKVLWAELTAMLESMDPALTPVPV